MERNILLIGESKRFMVNSLFDGFQAAGYTVTMCEPDIKEIAEVSKDISVYVMFLNEGYSNDLYVYLKDTVKDRKISLFLIGEKYEIEQAQKILDGFIKAEFLRPVNATAVSGKLDAEFARREKRQAMKKILVVDDDPEMLYALEEILSTKFCVFMANSGMNAIALLAKEEVDLILLDYEMPVLDGSKILEMLKSEPQTVDIPVMFLTGHGDKEHVMSVLQYNPVRYLLKSLPAAELISIIENFFYEKDMKA